MSPARRPPRLRASSYTQAIVTSAARAIGTRSANGVAPSTA